MRQQDRRERSPSLHFTARTERQEVGLSQQDYSDPKPQPGVLLPVIGPQPLSWVLLKALLIRK